MSYFNQKENTKGLQKYNRPKAGFNKKVIDELIIKARHLKENKGYMSFIMDAIKVQQNFS